MQHDVALREAARVIYDSVYGIARAGEVFEQQVAERKARHSDFNWPMKIDRHG